MTKTICVNFYAGPGSGKSTMAAGVFSELKNRGVDCELITEYAKRKVWEEAYKVFECQIYVCAKQIYHMFIARVPVIITDSPLLLATAYNDGDELLNGILHREYNKYTNIDIFLNRTKEYNENGRMQTLSQAIDKDNQIKDMLKKYNVEPVYFDGNRDSIIPVADFIMEKI